MNYTMRNHVFEYFPEKHKNFANVLQLLAEAFPIPPLFCVDQTSIPPIICGQA